MIAKKGETEEENLGVREWTKEDEMGNMVNPYYDL